jgi:multidrug efflux pump subunit AcrB
MQLNDFAPTWLYFVLWGRADCLSGVRTLSRLLLRKFTKLVPTLEDGLIWRRNRLPNMSILGDMADKTQPATMAVLMVATSLTCLFSSALYAAWFRVREV